METPKIDMFLGTVKEVKDRTSYEIIADIPGVMTDVPAYPYSRGEMDEPVAGNLILLMSLDPAFHSCFLYTKLKENDFTGIRCNGKLIDIQPSNITVGVYETDKTYSDEVHPEATKSYIRMDEDGNIEIMATGNEKIDIKGNAEVTVSKDATVNIEGNAEINVKGNCHLDAPFTQITGQTLRVDGKSVPNPQGGPFCAIPTCPLLNAPHTGNLSLGN